MNVNEFQDECVRAAQQCPQFANIDYLAIDTDSLSKAIRYWMDSTSVGGNLLWNKGYCEELDEEVLDIFEEARELTEITLENRFD